MLLIMYVDHTLDCYHELLFLTLWWPYSTLWWHVHTLLVKFKMALIVTSFTCYETWWLYSCSSLIMPLLWTDLRYISFCDYILILITLWLQCGLLFIYLFFLLLYFILFVYLCIMICLITRLLFDLEVVHD